MGGGGSNFGFGWLFGTGDAIPTNLTDLTAVLMKKLGVAERWKNLINPWKKLAEAIVKFRNGIATFWNGVHNLGVTMPTVEKTLSYSVTMPGSIPNIGFNFGTYRLPTGLPSLTGIGDMKSGITAMKDGIVEYVEAMYLVAQRMIQNASEVVDFVSGSDYDPRLFISASNSTVDSL